MLLRTPVLTKHGITYEQVAILNHVRMFKIDPIANQPLSESEIVPNLNLSHAVEAFLAENPWAFEYREDDNIQNINFDA